MTEAITCDVGGVSAKTNTIDKEVNELTDLSNQIVDLAIRAKSKLYIFIQANEELSYEDSMYIHENTEGVTVLADDLKERVSCAIKLAGQIIKYSERDGLSEICRKDCIERIKKNLSRLFNKIKKTKSNLVALIKKIEAYEILEEIKKIESLFEELDDLITHNDGSEDSEDEFDVLISALSDKLTA